MTRPCKLAECTEDCYKGRCRKEREQIIAKRQARLAERATDAHLRQTRYRRVGTTSVAEHYCGACGAPWTDDHHCSRVTGTRVEIEGAVADAIYAAYERGRRHGHESRRALSYADTFRAFGEPLLKRLDGRE